VLKSIQPAVKIRWDIGPSNLQSRGYTSGRDANSGTFTVARMGKPLQDQLNHLSAGDRIACCERDRRGPVNSGQRARAPLGGQLLFDRYGQGRGCRR